MDNDLISRQAAIDALLKLVEVRRTWISTEAARKEISGIDASMCAIHDLPSAERRGRWEDVEHAPNWLLYATCSVCGKRQTVESVVYCGNCGARMEASE